MKMSVSVTSAADLRAHANRLRKQADDLEGRADRVDAALEGIDELLNGTAVASAPKARKGSSGRPKGSKNKPKDDAAQSVAVEDANKLGSLRELLTEILKKNKTGLTLAELVKETLRSGYKSKTKGKFSQIVYQNLYKLMKDEHTIEKNKDTKKYRLKDKAAA